jgi:hypothetical protein
MRVIYDLKLKSTKLAKIYNVLYYYLLARANSQDRILTKRAPLYVSAERKRSSQESKVDRLLFHPGPECRQHVVHAGAFAEA